MRIIISPAKKMIEDADGPWSCALPAFLPRTERILDRLRSMSAAELKALWACSDRIADVNTERLAHMELRRGLTPAILAYEGIQYRHMAPRVFSEDEFAWAQEHLRILSGFYGVLRPFDGVVPYRLEMQARLSVDGARDLYEFWDDVPAAALSAETDCILNLASKEYSLSVSRSLRAGVRFVTCVFGEERNGKIMEKGTLCKMARGEMVRWMAENGVARPEEIREFDRLKYRFAPERSDAETYVFVKTERAV